MRFAIASRPSPSAVSQLTMPVWGISTVMR
ncbi:Uncharacterised protein [Vibrio cholerae]|nr:Uncharacterised protein [Vibrio cholerae]